MNLEIRSIVYLLFMLCLTATTLMPADAFAKENNLLANKHAAMGVKCEDCHSYKKESAPAGVEACLKCHGGYAGMAKRTAKKDTSGGYLSNVNPHDSHMGNVECYECHTAHNKSVKSFCDRCHTFTFVAP